MKYTFWKLSGAGNDFITFDNREDRISEEKKSMLARTLCPRGHSIGADGVLFIEKSSCAPFLMRIFNSDGSESDTCGNASRCIARLAMELDIAPAEMTFETKAGLYRARVEEKKVSVSMTDPKDLKTNIKIEEAWMPTPLVHFINTGIAHIVLFVDDLEGIEVFQVGRKLRYHPVFDPPGTNVNFVKVMDEHNLRIRTYERGVENETLACGTGCVAASVISASFDKVKSPVKLMTRGGIINIVHFNQETKPATGIRLEGEGRIVFKGEIDLDE